MCYFVEINLSRQQLKKRFNVKEIVDPRYMESNLLSAFNKPFLPVITSEFSDSIQSYQWGLIPSWVKDRQTADKISNVTYNARSETIFDKVSFKSAVNYHRCLVLVHGFFEWHSRGKIKTPFYIKRKDNEAFAIAGIYSKWGSDDKEMIKDTFSVITTRANPLMEKIHNTKKRMPVILSPNDEKEYLSPDLEQNEIKEFYRPIDESSLIAYPVNKKFFNNHVNSQNPNILIPMKENPLHYTDEHTLF